MAEFRTWRAFWNFEREVCRQRRFVRTSAAENFLESVRATCMSRSMAVPKGRGFWRAQEGHGWRHIREIDDEVPSPHGPTRMRPQADRAAEGRVNPKGVPVLYMSTRKEAAMCEIRPWLGVLISLGHFVTLRDLKIVDCSRYHDKADSSFFEEPSPEEVDTAVWTHIDKAFSKPVTRSDETSEYVATQILAEQFRALGFDGVAYKSAFGKQAFNVALFDLDSAKLDYCELHEATSAQLNFAERGDPYWVNIAKKLPPKSRKSKSRSRRRS